MAGGTDNTGGRIKHSWHIGVWGDPYAAGGSPCKGVVSYTISGNRQRPFAGYFSRGISNTIRRARNQVLYVVPPFIVAYYTMEWANERNEYLSSKAGRAEYGEE